MYSKRFERAVDRLVKAYHTNNLSKGNCKACAVGNICQDDLWGLVFSTDNLGNQSVRPSYYRNRVKRIIDATEYTWQELAQVEKAFEENTVINIRAEYLHDRETIDKDMHNGLMAVLDVLLELEGVEDDMDVRKRFTIPI